ncbi:2-hydroxyacid dehydrogenase [Nesterenkonia sphaerica]|uniref:D-glycerate dehydrogenase n=1 Tax=Nesterenkonia sphaerica TaxID=1804988 RepID=A0A5R9AH81_9MICC|nr:D-glycerate dehydrogenase [Nesterenkonia sphaerica]TLP77524.1 D-glycerate dehydrogenase [Nesterenkonia sphaerica]
MSENHVFVTRPLSAKVMQEARRSLPVTLESHPSKHVPPNRKELLNGCRGASGLIVMLTDRVDEEVLDAAGPQLRVIANVAVGFDNIDVEAAARRGIVVTNTPGVLDEATADLAFALLLATVRRLVEADRFVRAGNPWIWGPQSFVGLDISAGATLGIVGLGRTGMAVARRAHAFGMRILATGSRASSAEAAELDVVASDLEGLLEASDVVSLHCPLTADNRHMIGRAQLDSMKRGSFLINTARGPLVDEEALADALDNGHLAGAGLDVHEHEPQVNARLREMEKVVLLPHVGSAAATTRDAMGALAVRNVTEVLSGREPVSPVGTPPG